MRKSALIKEIDELIEKNGILFTKCRELETVINEKNAVVSELEEKIELLTAENQQLKNSAASCPMPLSAEVKEVVSSASADNETEVAENKEPTENLLSRIEDVSETKADNDNGSVVELPCDFDVEQQPVIFTAASESTQITEPAETAMKLASEAIGRVVIKSAQLCNEFAAEGNQNSKDLINLALGRTEVFKSEALSLVSTEEMSDERFEAELRSREAAVNEYFELLSRQ